MAQLIGYTSERQCSFFNATVNWLHIREAVQFFNGTVNWLQIKEAVQFF